jgi:putative intracellular protease/amidase
MNIAIPVFEGFTALDAIGPYEVLSRLPGANMQLLAAEAGPIRTQTGMALVANATFDEVIDPEVIVVPGGHVTRELLGDKQLLGWLRRAHERSQWTASV